MQTFDYTNVDAGLEVAPVVIKATKKARTKAVKKAVKEFDLSLEPTQQDIDAKRDAYNKAGGYDGLEKRARVVPDAQPGPCPNVFAHVKQYLKGVKRSKSGLPITSLAAAFERAVV